MSDPSTSQARAGSAYADIKSPIAIDGPAASGKGTIARRLAALLAFDYLDTGALYRAVALAMQERQIDFHHVAEAAHIAHHLDLNQLEHADTKASIRRPEIGVGASIVAAFPEVRQAILEAQRLFARHAQKGAILDGRDIGTIVCPDAPHKLYITADAEIRAHRRWQELKTSTPDLDFETVLQDIKDRDARDMNRSTAPLRQADDAHLLDTSDLSIEGAVNAALALLLAT